MGVTDNMVLICVTLLLVRLVVSMLSEFAYFVFSGFI